MSTIQEVYKNKQYGDENGVFFLSNTDIFIFRKLNITVSQYYGVFWEYIEVLKDCKAKYQQQLDDFGFGDARREIEFKILHDARTELNKLVMAQIKKEQKCQKTK